MTQTAPAEQPFVGAYALLDGLDEDAETAAYRALRELPVAGLELPLSRTEQADRWFGRNVTDAWDLVVTCIPTVMQRLTADPGYGLASTRAEGLAAALADVTAAAAFARRLADVAGRPRVRAIQIHSAPRRETSSREAFARSLDAIEGLDAAGAVMAVEHCDAARPGRPFHKGFLELADEVAALAGRSPRLGVTVNWGRSAIEGRSAAAPLEHVRSALAAGRLVGLMFSGTTGRPSPWGELWDDGHMAPRGPAAALQASADSLLGPAEVAELVGLAQDAHPYLGVKVTVRPRDADLAHRLAVARAALGQLSAGVRAPSRAG